VIDPTGKAFDVEFGETVKWTATSSSKSRLLARRSSGAAAGSCLTVSAAARLGKAPVILALIAGTSRRTWGGHSSIRLSSPRLARRPVLGETSSLDAKDVDDDPGRPPTPTEAAMDHHVVAFGHRERAFIPPRETAPSENSPSRPGAITALCWRYVGEKYCSAAARSLR